MRGRRWQLTALVVALVALIAPAVAADKFAAQVSAKGPASIRGLEAGEVVWLGSHVDAGAFSGQYDGDVLIYEQQVFRTSYRDGRPGGWVHETTTEPKLVERTMQHGPLEVAIRDHGFCDVVPTVAYTMHGVRAVEAQVRSAWQRLPQQRILSHEAKPVGATEGLEISGVEARVDAAVAVACWNAEVDAGTSSWVAGRIPGTEAGQGGANVTYATDRYVVAIGNFQSLLLAPTWRHAAQRLQAIANESVTLTDVEAASGLPAAGQEPGVVELAGHLRIQSVYSEDGSAWTLDGEIGRGRIDGAALALSAVGTTAVAALGWLAWRLLPSILALATRPSASHPRRNAIVAAVASAPGVTPAELAAMTGIPRSTVLFHTSILVRQRKVVMHKHGKTVHLHVVNGESQPTNLHFEAPVLALSRNTVRRAILAELARGDATTAQLVARMPGFSTPLVLHHLGRLAEAGIVLKRGPRRGDCWSAPHLNGVPSQRITRPIEVTAP